ncbi:interleukin-1 receptor accessory protein-like isoform X2 [Salarias fasciatus]|uniref:interleukin-1 receptor accessory protein-like isoform X2 n=1 Tax=Salarias fasciatus TaxID=181472 RepID=UPI001177097A|nr:interleukin-1 receptor accessory protein-like isoform X2 [Salarias fasciatus]
MRLQAVVNALGSLCLLLADGFPVEEDFPEIIGSKRVQIKVRPGEELMLHCDAFTNCAEDEAVIYWLVNDSFPEDAPSADRIIESKERTFEDGAIVQRSLLLKNVTAEDLKSTFKCVVTNAVGTAQKKITLHATTRNCASG